MDTLTFVLAAMTSLIPDADHAALGSSIARAVDAQPWPRDYESRRQIAALLVAVAYREGRLGAFVEGDHDKSGKPHSFCTMQIHDASGGTPALNEDLDLCVTTGLKMLRTSRQMCPEHPVAFYAEGYGGCASKRAQRISADRIALARKVAGRATQVIVPERPKAKRGDVMTVTISPRDAAVEAFRHDLPLFARVRGAAEVVGML